MGFQLVQMIYWLSLSVWFGGAMFIAISWQSIHRTISESNPILPNVLSVNLEGQHGTLLAGAIVGNLVAVLTRIEMICAAVLLIAIACQWFLIDLADAWIKASAFVRTILAFAATGVVAYNGFVLWPRIMKVRQEFIQIADDPDKANPLSERLDRLQRDSEMLLMVLIFLLLGIILFSGDIHAYQQITVRTAG